MNEQFLGTEQPSVQFSCSVVPDSLWPHGLCSTPDFSVHHQLLELVQAYVHQVSDAIQPSHPLSSPFPPALHLSQHQGLFRWFSSSRQEAEVWVALPPFKWYEHRSYYNLHSAASSTYFTCQVSKDICICGPWVIVSSISSLQSWGLLLKSLWSLVLYFSSI